MIIEQAIYNINAKAVVMARCYYNANTVLVGVSSSNFVEFDPTFEDADRLCQLIYGTHGRYSTASLDQVNEVLVELLRFAVERPAKVG